MDDRVKVIYSIMKYDYTYKDNDKCVFNKNHIDISKTILDRLKNPNKEPKYLVITSGGMNYGMPDALKGKQGHGSAYDIHSYVRYEKPKYKEFHPNKRWWQFWIR